MGHGVPEPVERGRQDRCSVALALLLFLRAVVLGDVVDVASAHALAVNDEVVMVGWKR